MSELANDVFNMVRNNRATEAVEFIKTRWSGSKTEARPEAEIVDILTKSETIWYLARSGQAEALAEIIGNLSLPAQEKILSGPFVLEDLACAGQGAALIVLIDKQPTIAAQQNILDGWRRTEALRRAGFGKDVERIRDGWYFTKEATLPGPKTSGVPDRKPAPGV